MSIGIMPQQLRGLQENTLKGGLIGAAGIRNPQRTVRAGQCPGGQLAGAPLDAAGLHASQAA